MSDTLVKIAFPGSQLLQAALYDAQPQHLIETADMNAATRIIMYARQVAYQAESGVWRKSDTWDLILDAKTLALIEQAPTITVPTPEA